MFGKIISAVVIKLRISSYNHPGLLLNPMQVSLQEKGREKADTEEKARRSKRQRCGSHGETLGTAGSWKTRAWTLP